MPLVPEDCLLGLRIDDSIESLKDFDCKELVYESVADWLMRNPSMMLGVVLPGLWLVRDDDIGAALDLPARSISALARHSIAVWGDLLEMTPSFLSDIRGFGEGCMQCFLKLAVGTSVEACACQRPPSRLPTVNVFEALQLPPLPKFRTAQFRRLADWGVNEAGALTLGDLFVVSSEDNVPEDLVLIRDAIRATRLSELFPGISRHESLESLLDDLCGVLDQRSRTIFLGRIALTHFRTLEDFAIEMGVTRERIRQLAVRAEKRIREALEMPRFVPVGWRAHRLRKMLGIAVPICSPHFEEASQYVARDVSELARERVVDFLLWLGGPYSRNTATGWLEAGIVPGPKVIGDFSDARGRIDIERLREYLTGCGILAPVQPAWLEQIGKIRKIDGHWLLWTGTVCDKAARLLELCGQPMTPDEIVSAIGEGHDVRASRCRFLEDERFMRTDMTRVGLRAWGLEEYSTIAEEIEQELDRRGGTADLADLISTLASRFNLRESSIKNTVNVPMFVLEGNTIRRRTGMDAHAPIPPVTETPGSYLIGPDAVMWRVDVTHDTLRGSGRPLLPSIAGWLGLLPGGRRSLVAGDVTVNITWPETSVMGPSLGSIRSLVEKAKAKEGEQVLLRFRRDEGTIDVQRIDSSAASSVHGLERLSLLTGIPNGSGETRLLSDIGLAIGAQGTRAAIIAALKRRGEPELAALVPGESASPELDEAIDALKDLF
jgi:hypothetical protein